MFGGKLYCEPSPNQTVYTLRRARCSLRPSCVTPFCADTRRAKSSTIIAVKSISCFNLFACRSLAGRQALLVRENTVAGEPSQSTKCMSSAKACLQQTGARLRNINKSVMRRSAELLAHGRRGRARRSDSATNPIMFVRLQLRRRAAREKVSSVSMTRTGQAATGLEDRVTRVLCYATCELQLRRRGTRAKGDLAAHVARLLLSITQTALATFVSRRPHVLRAPQKAPIRTKRASSLSRIKTRRVARRAI